MESLVGRTISHYKILERIAEGGMGVVYKALDLRLDRQVALKVLSQRLNTGENSRKRFVAEAKAASALDDPHIATIYEIDEAPEIGLFIVMAYYPGKSLSQLIEKGSLEVPVAIDLAIQIGTGLAHAHEHGIVHRDIKPGNIVVTTAGLVKILDFGLAKAKDVHLTDAGLSLGTPAFMSPEQVHGDTVDHRTDVWALGVVLYNMITGRLPFVADDARSLDYRIAIDVPEQLEAPAAVRTIILKALSKRPENRQASMNTFVAELQEVRRTLQERGEFQTTASAPLPSTHGATGEGTALTTASVPKTRRSGERRQLTVLSCELDCESLTERTDPEQLREVLLTYHKVCEEAVRRFDGRIAQRLDAELNIHFGYPRAHEDDAYRAVAAGLGIVASVRAARDSQLRVRVGIHTGQVIAEDPAAAKDTLVVGVAGTLATKTRDLAGWDDVVITEDTYRLVQGFFTFRPVEARQDRGAATRVYHVVGRTSATSRIEAAAAAGLTDLVGRDRELDLLAARWDEVKEGSGQAVLLSGEAGVGKSRLVQALKQRLADEHYTLLECRCSSYSQNSPLSPLLDLIGHIFGLEKEVSPGGKLERLRKSLSEHGLGSPDDLRIFASLLSLSLPDGQAGSTIVPQREREAALASLLRLLLDFSSRGPVLFIVEDLHWVNPTTLELLGLVVDQGPTTPIFTILTFRPEFTSPWPHLNHLNLSRLSRRESEQMVERVTTGRRLPDELVAHIVGHSDGVPLFIEEITKAVLESDVIENTENGARLKGPLVTATIPATLSDSLMARLDRLGSAKAMAQFASVLGRTFSYEWLEAALPVGKHRIREDLSRLVEAGLLYQQGMPPRASFTFKHALIKDAAYHSLLSRTRQQYHEQVARALEQRFPELKRTQPELLAHHYTDAGLAEQAVTYWRRAGEQALERSANVEAASHFGKGLEGLASLPETADRRQQRLDLVIALGGAQVATRGYAATVVGEAYSQAFELCAQVGESPQLFDALQGLYAFHLVRGDLKCSLDLSDRLIDVAARLDDEPRSLDATLRRGISHYTLGNLIAAREHLEVVLVRSLDDEPRESARRFGQDRLVACLSHLSVVLWLSGLPQQAVVSNERALTRAKDQAHPFSIAFALLYAAIVRSLRAEVPAVQRYAEELADLSREQGFAYRLAQSQILEGWAQAVGERDERAIERIRSGIQKTRATGAEVLLPYYPILLADGCLRTRQIEPGLEVVREALDLVERTGERFFEAELQRLHGELLIRSGASPSEAGTWITQSLKTARSQHALSFELRTAVSLARLNRGDESALRQVEQVVHRFSEGFDTPDLRAARDLAS